MAISVGSGLQRSQVVRQGHYQKEQKKKQQQKQNENLTAMYTIQSYPTQTLRMKAHKTVPVLWRSDPAFRNLSSTKADQGSVIYHSKRLEASSTCIHKNLMLD